MLNPAQLRSAEARKALRDLARGLAMPLSIHFCEDGEERFPIASTSGCRACSAVSKLDGGAEACAESRAKATRDALRADAPRAFVCHMGFSCVCAPLRDHEAGKGYVLTAGPFTPSELPDGRAHDALQGFQQLDEDMEKLPCTLGDIALTPAAAVPVQVQWAVDRFHGVLDTLVEPEEPPGDEPRPDNRARRRMPDAGPYQAADLATALTAGDRTQARAIARAVLAEGTDSEEGARLRAIALVAATLERVAAAGFDTQAAAEKLAELPSVIAGTSTDKARLDTVMHVLGVIANHARKDGGDESLAALNRLMIPRMADRVRLKDLAAELGQDPTAISHRLRRKYGLTFTEYLGRIRVDEGKRLLRTTRLTVRECATRVGITDPANFTRLFRRHENMTPNEYRKRFGKQP